MVKNIFNTSKGVPYSEIELAMVIVTMISLYYDGRCHTPIVLVGPVIVTVAVLVTVMVLIVEMVSSVSWFKSRWFFCNDPSKV